MGTYYGNDRINAVLIWYTAKSVLVFFAYFESFLLLVEYFLCTYVLSDMYVSESNYIAVVIYLKRSKLLSTSTRSCLIFFNSFCIMNLNLTKMAPFYNKKQNNVNTSRPKVGYRVYSASRMCFRNFSVNSVRKDNFGSFKFTILK